MKRLLFSVMMLLAVVLFIDPDVHASDVPETHTVQVIDFEQASAKAVAVADQSINLQVENIYKQTVKEVSGFLPGDPPTVSPGDQDHQLIVLRPQLNLLEGYRPYLARSNLSKYLA